MWYGLKVAEYGTPMGRLAKMDPSWLARGVEKPRLCDHSWMARRRLWLAVAPTT